MVDFMWRRLSIVVSAVALVAGGVIQGHINSRWQSGHELMSAFPTIETLPTTIGNWEGQDFDFPEDQLRTADVLGCLSRRYVNRVDGTTINLLLFWGRPGPIALHPPTVCFPSSGLHLDALPVRTVVHSEGIAAEFLFGVFSKLEGGVPVRLHTYWTWSGRKRHGRNGWLVPDNPRMAFAREPYLFKMYVTHAIQGARRSSDEDACVDFIQLVLPELERVLPAT
jgi:hypothetical protein